MPFINTVVEDDQGNFVQPRLPNNYDLDLKPYCHRGFLFNLKPGDYIVYVPADNVKGKKWLFRAVSPHVTLTVME